MHHPLISLLILIPLGFALASLAVPATAVRSFRTIALSASLLQLVVLIYMLMQYQPGTLQFEERYSWITLDLEWGTLKAEYFVGVDGLSMPLVALTVVIMLIAVISSWNIDKNVKGYFVL